MFKKIAATGRRLLGTFYRQGIVRTCCYGDLLLSKWRHAAPNIKQRHVYAQDTRKKYLCIFSHFDQHNIIDSHVLHYLESLSAADCDIVFVSTSNHLSDEECNKIRGFCKKIIVKENRGRDFGAFKCGILDEAADIARYEKVILANDSVYGPFYALQNIIHYGDDKKCDMWGASDSWEKKYHLQSYFVVFGASIIRNKWFMSFWQNVAYTKYRQSVIEFYEIGMSQYFLRKGYRLGAWCAFKKIKQDLLTGVFDRQIEKQKYEQLFHLRLYCNPTHDLWDVMIQLYQFPFIKRELLLKNPRRIDITDWADVIKRYSIFDTHLISNHLARLTQSV